MNGKTISDQEVFWLARYAHNTIAPLMAEVKKIEPTTKFSMELNFDNPEAKHADGHVSLFAHWDRDGMFLYSTRHQSKSYIDQLAVEVQAEIDKLRVKA